MLSRPRRLISVRQTRAWDFNLIVYLLKFGLFACLMVFNATFSNISAISWRSVLLVDETGGPGDYHRPVASHWQIYHIMLYTSPWSRFELAATTIRSRPNDGPAKSWFKQIMSNTNVIQQIITTVSSWMKRNSLCCWPAGGWSSLL